MARYIDGKRVARDTHWREIVVVTCRHEEPVIADIPYVIDEFEVFVNTWGVDSHLRRPTRAERAILDRYFATAARAPDGRIMQLGGDEIAGIEGDILTYPAAQRE
mgnify:CR=1 FL=1